MAYSGYSYMANAAAPQGVSGFRPMFVLIGDSITEFSFLDGGWGTTLASWYNRRVSCCCCWCGGGGGGRG